VKTVATVAELRRARASLRGAVGLVPTMGALHAGHLSLVERARAECDHVGVSIFVNPTQFGPNEDLARYPRNVERDLRLLEPLGVDLVWIPEVGDVYPAGFQTRVVVHEVSAPLEGAARPGHFAGVATVVAKLFNAFTPARAYFGQKDAQQVSVIHRMTRDLDFAVEIVVCPTVREADGLALSSRNSYLGPEERQAAPVLYRALLAAQAAYCSGERDARVLRRVMGATIGAERLAHLDYASAADPSTMEEVDRAGPGTLLSLAARVGNVRLIDNLVLA
jgi:pantoate--beta-alanine ligase